MTRTIATRPLIQNEFAIFGDVLEITGKPDNIINQGMCDRHHDLANMDFSTGQAGISLFNSKARSLPFMLEMMERHPCGSQAFIPMHQNPFLIIVAEDKKGKPGTPIAFLSGPGQAINFHKNIWHGVLCPLHAPGLFAAIDRIGDGTNLEEHWFEKAWTII